LSEFLVTFQVNCGKSKKYILPFVLEMKKKIAEMKSDPQINTNSAFYHLKIGININTISSNEPAKVYVSF
jgi:hypothetical protein